MFEHHHCDASRCDRRSRLPRLPPPQDTELFVLVTVPRTKISMTANEKEYTR